MHLTVGDENRAGKALGRYLGKGLAQGGEQAGAILARGDPRARRHHPELDIAEPRHRRLEGCERRVGLGMTIAEILALAVVDNGDRDVAQILALLIAEGRVEQGKKESGKSQGAKR